jgi:thiol-disulfide isomerase/thioredoxin
MSLFPKPVIAVAVALLSAAACQSEASLKVGSAAPALQVSRWVKGDGPSKFEPGKVYVVEFWATWCLPCRQSIPHLTKMARDYRDRVAFVGVSVFEGESAAVEKRVDSFVHDMGNNMDYFVARDTKSDAMAKTWLQAAGRKGIPCVFIVDGSGKIAWIGHPMDFMKEAIDAVLVKIKS